MVKSGELEKIDGLKNLRNIEFTYSDSVPFHVRYEIIKNALVCNEWYIDRSLDETPNHLPNIAKKVELKKYGKLSKVSSTLIAISYVGLCLL